MEKMKEGRTEEWKRGFCIEGKSEGLNEGSTIGRELCKMNKGVMKGSEGINE